MNILDFLQDCSNVNALKSKLDFTFTKECLKAGIKENAFYFADKVREEMTESRAKGKVIVRKKQYNDGIRDDKVLSILTYKNQEALLSPKWKEIVPQVIDDDTTQEEVIKCMTNFRIEYQEEVEEWFQAFVDFRKEELIKKQKKTKEVAEEIARKEALETSYEVFCKTFMDLPEITANTSVAVLARVGRYRINMQIIINNENMHQKGCKIYLSEMFTEKLFINGDNELNISKEKILGTEDHNVMNCLDCFNIVIGDDVKKKAFDRAKTFLKVSKKNTILSDSRNIEDVFKELQKTAIFEAKAEVENSQLSSEQYKYKYNAKERTIAIRDNHLQNLLDKIDSGYQKIVFCKKIRMLEIHKNVTYIISNRNGSGYGYNETGNIRYYKFNILDDEE